MNLDAYSTHIIQKLKLAVSIAIIQTKPDNLTVNEYIEVLKSKISDKMDEDFDISVCSDDFDLDFSTSLEEEHNTNNRNYNNSPSIINHDVLDNISHNNNNVQEHLIKNSATNTVNHSATKNNNIKPTLIENNNAAYKNNSKYCTDAITNNNATHTNKTIINEVPRNNIQNPQDYYDILFDNNNPMIINDGREELINSPTILEDFESLLEENFIENMKIIEQSIEDDSNLNALEKNLSQDIFIASQNNDLTQSPGLNFCQTISNTDQTAHIKTQKDITQHKNENNEKSNNFSANKNNPKHIIDLDEDLTNPKKKINLDVKAKTGNTQPNISPDAKFRSNVTKFLENNNMTAKSTPDKNTIKVDTANEIQIEKTLPFIRLDNAKTKEVVNIKDITKFTQNTSYSQSQPMFLIDRRYMYENRKPILIINNNTVKNASQTDDIYSDQNHEVIKEIVTADSKLDDRQNKSTFKIKDKESIIQVDTQIAQEMVPDTHSIKKVLSNDTDLNFQGEIYLFSQDVSTNCENNTRNYDTQELYNNFVKTNNLTQNTSRTIDIHTKNHTKDAQASKINENANKINVKDEEINATSLKEPKKYININNQGKTYNKIVAKHNPNEEIKDLNQIDFEHSTHHNIRRMDIMQKDNPNQTLIDLTQKDTTKTNNFVQNNTTTIIENVNNNLDHNDTIRINNLSQETFNFNSLSQQSNQNSNFSQNTQMIERQNSNSSDLEIEDELIPFKVIEELNKVKNYLNKLEAKSTDESDTGYKSDSQNKSLKSTQSNVWLNQSAHSLFNYISTCPLINRTQDITKEISIILGQLVDKLHENEQYPTFLEEILEATDLMINLVYEDNNFEESQLLKKDEIVQRIFLLTKSSHLQKYTIEKITTTLEKLLQILTSKDSIQEIENIQKIENSCYIFNILQNLLQKYYKKTINSQKDTKSHKNSQNSQFSSQFSNNSNKNSSQYSSQNSQSSQSIKKTDISDIWRKKWNPNFKELSLESETERKCVLSECSKVLNSLIVNCMEGYSLVAYFALKCFNLMQN